MTYVFQFLSVFYTSAETERRLNDIYEKHVQQKQKKLDEREQKTGEISKYTARALVKIPHREFYVMADGVVYYKSHDTFLKCPKEQEQEEGGGVYKLEPSLLGAVKRFQSRYTTFRVVFEPSLNYKGNDGACRATLYSIPSAGGSEDSSDFPEILTIEDESNYVI
jgi:hypothetical protein